MSSNNIQCVKHTCTTYSRPWLALAVKDTKTYRESLMLWLISIKLRLTSRAGSIYL